MKKKLLTLLFAMVAIAASAFDYGDFRYTVQADGTATIFGFKSGYTGSPTSITIPGYCFDSSTQKYYKVKTIGPSHHPVWCGRYPRVCVQRLHEPEHC